MGELVTENVLISAALIMVSWNAWISLALIKIMIDLAIVKKTLNGEIQI